MARRGQAVFIIVLTFLSLYLMTIYNVSLAFGDGNVPASTHEYRHLNLSGNVPLATEDGTQNASGKHHTLDDEGPSEDLSLPGHMKPFGESGKRSPVPEVSGYPDNLLRDYLVASKPLLMKGAAKLSPAFTRWTDHYLTVAAKASHNVDVELFVEKGKKEDREGEDISWPLDKFLHEYNTSDVYLVDDLPSFLKPDVTMPCALQCPSMSTVPMMSVMWFSSGGTNSVVHTDSYDNINCLFRGRKTLVLVDPNSFPVGSILDRLDGAFSKIDVDKVDLNRYPTLRGTPFLVVDMEPGDCLFIPYRWVHQVRSYDNNLAVNFWIDHYDTLDILESRQCLDDDLRCDLTSTLDQWPNPSADFEDPRSPHVMRTDKDFLYVVFELGAYHIDGSVGNQATHTTVENIKIETFLDQIELRYLLDIDQVDNDFQSSTRHTIRKSLSSADEDNDGMLSRNEFDSNFDIIWKVIVELVEKLDEKLDEMLDEKLDEKLDEMLDEKLDEDIENNKDGEIVETNEKVNLLQENRSILESNKDEL